MSRREVRVINRVFTAREPIERAGVRTSLVVHRCLSTTHQSAKYKSSMKYLMLASLPSYAKTSRCTSIPNRLKPSVANDFVVGTKYLMRTFFSSKLSSVLKNL